MKWKLFRYILTLVSMKFIKKKNTLDILTVSFIFGHFVHGPLSSSSQSESSCLRSHRVCEVPWRSRQYRGGFCQPSPTVCYHRSSSTFQTQVRLGTFCCSSPQMEFSLGIDPVADVVPD